MLEDVHIHLKANSYKYYITQEYKYIDILKTQINEINTRIKEIIDTNLD